MESSSVISLKTLQGFPTAITPEGIFFVKNIFIYHFLGRLWKRNENKTNNNLVILDE